MRVTKKNYGMLADGKPVDLFTLDNGCGMKVEIIEFGAIVKEIWVPDRDGNTADVVLGYNDLEGYIRDPYYFGATVGRVANRMGGAAFSLGSVKYNLAPNTLPDFGENHLHGGVKGFNKVLWSGESFTTEDEVGVRLSYLSPDGEEGYPGNVECTVEYTLNASNELGVRFLAFTDKTTLVNMTHHSYFNLAGAGSGTILDHLVEIHAKQYTPADDDLIPVGEIAEVSGLPVDFTEEIEVGSRLGQMKLAKFTGYDLNYVFHKEKGGKLVDAAKATDPLSGRTLEVLTDQPCMHFYTSNFLSGEPGKDKKSYNRYGALCFEPQGFPDAPNHWNFLPVRLEPGETYNRTIIYRFSVNK